MNSLVVMKNKQAVTTSLQIATSFNKRHDHILRDIRNLEKDIPKVGEKNMCNFTQMFFTGKAADSYGRDRRIYFVNRDGFTLLAMGFTGKKALEFKFKYIDAFNAMERALNKLPEEKLNPVLQAELAVTRAKTAKANALYRIAMATASETSKQTLLANAAKEITGEMIIPALQHKEYSATEVAKLVNASSANKVGRICNKLGLKAEQPGQNEYGRWASSKSKYSNKETPQWLYFDKGVTAIRQAMLKN